MCKKLDKLANKPKKINYPKHRAKRAEKVFTLKEYKNGDYTFPSMNNYEELFIGNCMILDAQHDIKNCIYHNNKK